jgi:hypothetical protein
MATNACMFDSTSLVTRNSRLISFHSKYKSWKVTGLLPWSALLFTAGFIMRTIGAFGQWGNIGIFIASTVLLLVGP